MRKVLLSWGRMIASLYVFVGIFLLLSLLFWWAGAFVVTLWMPFLVGATVVVALIVGLTTRSAVSMIAFGLMTAIVASMAIAFAYISQYVGEGLYRFLQAAFITPTGALVCVGIGTTLWLFSSDEDESAKRDSDVSVPEKLERSAERKSPVETQESVVKVVVRRVAREGE